MPKLSIIIITFNSVNVIKLCLDSIFAQDYQDFEAIVIDNGSRDGTVNFIKENYPQINLIENRENLGAFQARNQGIETALGKWILTLDCDTILEKNFLKKITEVVKESKESIGSFQPKILNIDKKTIYSCGIYLSKLRRFYNVGEGKQDFGQFDKTKQRFGVCSAAAVYNRRMLEELKESTGYFDERFFFLVEDVDLSWRAQRKGWKAMFLPEAICYHYGNSSNHTRKIRQFLSFRNRYRMIEKNETLSGKLRLIILSFWYEFLRIAYMIFTNKYLWKATKNCPPDKAYLRKKKAEV